MSLQHTVGILGRGAPVLAAAGGEEVGKLRQHKRRAPEPPKEEAEAKAEAARGAAAAVAAPSEARPSKVACLTYKTSKGYGTVSWKLPWHEGMCIRDVLDDIGAVFQDDVALRGPVGGVWPSDTLSRVVSETPITFGDAICVVVESSETRR
mgnify:FL=1